MAKELPYLPSYKNVEKLFTAIDQARRPEVLSTNVLADVFGIKGSGDRPLIALLKTLGFLDPAGRPTPTYDLLKNPKTARYALADGVRKAYAPLFNANENAHSLSGDELRGLIAQVAGADQGITRKIAGTFNSLVKIADFSQTPAKEEDDGQEEEERDQDEDDRDERKRPQQRKLVGLRPEFHYNIQIHLPANGTEETYLNIFNAIRKTFS